MFPPLLLSLELLHDGIFYSFRLFLHVLRWLCNFSIQANWLHALTLFCQPYIYRIKITWLYGWPFWYMLIFSFQTFSWRFLHYVLWHIDLFTFLFTASIHRNIINHVFSMIMGTLEIGASAFCIMKIHGSVEVKDRMMWLEDVHVFESLIPSDHPALGDCQT